MLRTPSLLAALLSTTVVVSVASAWGGWRLVDQQRALDQQRARERAESTADAIASSIRGKLAEAGERLSGWVSNPAAPPPDIDGAVVFAADDERVDVTPANSLPFVPFTAQASHDSTAFAALESVEFGALGAARAAEGYRALAQHSDARIRAGALIRLARVQRKLRDFAGAFASYERLASFGPVRIEDLPAELAALDGQRAVHLAMANDQAANVVARRLLRGLDEGRWQIGRGMAEFYREPFSDPRPASWRLAEALSTVWRDTEGRLPPRGQRMFRDEQARTTVLVIWRSNGTRTAALAASLDSFFATPRTTATNWQLTDPEGHVVGGDAAAPAQAVSRIIGNADYPWTLHTWDTAGASGSSRTILLSMMVAMLAFVWGASYFMVRAIRREAAVARLQSDFIAAVSHEFRSPLTAVRQMAEMLDEDRVLTTERRHTYYKIVAGEAARLQRLVETLLNFGRMEAGAQRYRFVDLDAAALIRDVVDDITPQARDAGKAIVIDAVDGNLRVRADQNALALALRNLIDNAIKYSPGQPVVWVCCRKDRDRAAICVVDRGVGIPRSEHRSIFGKFVRGRAAIDANIKGTGVGLSIVQQIVTAHAGDIRLDSEPGRGSTFTLLLPVTN